MYAERTRKYFILYAKRTSLARLAYKIFAVLKCLLWLAGTITAAAARVFAPAQMERIIVEVSKQKGSYGRGNHPNSRKNLITAAQRSPEERRSMGARGGKASQGKPRNQNARTVFNDHGVKIIVACEDEQEIAAAVLCVNWCMDWRQLREMLDQ